MQKLSILALAGMLLGAISLAPVLAASPACPQRANGGGEASGPAFAQKQNANGGGEASGPAFAQKQQAKGGSEGTQVASAATGTAPCN